MMYDGVKVDLTEEEIRRIEENLKRKPNMTEIGMIDVMWSEHCSYKSSRPELKKLHTSGSRVMIGPGQDAGVIDIGDGLALVFKIESHNHPSAIEPYNGAATGIGGIIRDILCMGARPIALVDPLRFGSLKSGHSRWLFKYVVKGIADYGNCIGVPTVAGEVEFDQSFESNCLVNVGCIGIATHSDIEQAPSKASDPGDYLIIMGGSTGRDGLGGVTFASRVLTEESEEDRPAVQVGDPFTKKLIIDATLDALKTGHVKGLKDLGGGGFTCVCTELAGSGGTGVEIDLNKMPLREKGMIPYEIMLSESQERMMFVIAPEHVDEIVKIFEQYEVPYSIIGKTTDSQRIVVYFNGEKVVDLPIMIFEDSPVYHRPARRPSYLDKIPTDVPTINEGDLEKIVYELLSSPNIASMKWVIEQYDHEVGVRTVIKPGEMGAAVLRILNSSKGIGITCAANCKFSYLDPYQGAMGAFAEACRNLATVGAEPIGMVDCLNFGNPENPEIFWQFKETIRGLADFGKFMDIPCVGGNVSFYNEDNVTGVAIKPVPELLLCGLIEKVSRKILAKFRNAGDVIFIVGKTRNELGGSEYASFIHDFIGGQVPRVNLDEEKRAMGVIIKLVRNEIINAVDDISRGGLAI
ncbi:MAG: phosphoribosylformylglycinamidine synthase subunit PurL, partial [Candidatus Helarchaeales archaeon]